MNMTSIIANAKGSPFHTNQIQAAEHIVTVFGAGEIHYALLWAEVQSGKTGTFHCVAQMMLASGLIDRVYILCGSHEISLYRQAIDDCDTYGTSHTEIVFRQHFERTEMNVERALLIVDESHMDQTQGQMLSAFLAKYELNMSGTLPSMREKETYILSVDATPYSEFSAHVHGHSLPKHIEYLVPGEGYYGPADYIREKRIHETFDIKERPDRFHALCSSKKWAVIRISSADTMKALREVRKTYGIKLLQYTSKRTQIAITRDEQRMLWREHRKRVPCLEDAPAVATVVVIKGRLRAGKVVPKKHVAFVWEDAVNPKIDTIVQSLFGRMCGYEFGEKKPYIFLPKSVLRKDDEKIVAVSEIVRHTMAPNMLPRKGTNLVSGRVAGVAGEGRYQCPAILMTLGEESEICNVRVTRDTVQRVCFEKLCEDDYRCVREFAHINNEQREEILGLLVGVDYRRDCHIRFMKESASTSRKNYFRELRSAYLRGTAPAEHVSDAPFLTFVVVQNYTDDGAIPGQVYCIFYTNTQGDRDTVHLESRIAVDNGRSIFSVHEIISP